MFTEKISGTIDKWRCPILECSIANEITMNSTKVIGIIDTGAYKYFLKQHFIDALNLPLISNVQFQHPIEGLVTANCYKGLMDFNFGVLSNISILPLILKSLVK